MLKTPMERERPGAQDLAGAERRCRRILERLFGPADTWRFQLGLPSGRETGNHSDPDFTLWLRHPGALRGALLPPTERSAGEAFVGGLLDVEGDLEAAIRMFRDGVLDREFSAKEKGWLLWNLLRLPRSETPEVPHAAELPSPRHSPEPDTIAVRTLRRYYDEANEFYDLWLDPWMQYSCAYFTTGREDLERAQETKLDMICLKLGLSPGDELLDVGCGWGGLVRYACREFGVRAVGITHSEDQAYRARRDVKAEGLEDRCRIEHRDYRDLPDDGRFDRVASVEMAEHLGRDHMEEYFRSVHDALRPGGLFLNMGIVSPAHPPAGPLGSTWNRFTRRRQSFVEAHLFPDGEPVPFSARVAPAEAAGFELRHAENLREHYALTLRHWVRRLESRWDEAVVLAGEAPARIWRLHMAGAADAFETGRLGLIHALYAKPGPSGTAEVPLRRPDFTGPRAPDRGGP